MSEVGKGCCQWQRKTKLPVGIDSFEKLRREGFYYADKTKLIEQILTNWGEANLLPDHVVSEKH